MARESPLSHEGRGAISRKPTRGRAMWFLAFQTNEDNTRGSAALIRSESVLWGAGRDRLASRTQDAASSSQSTVLNGVTYFLRILW